MVFPDPVGPHTGYSDGDAARLQHDEQIRRAALKGDLSALRARSHRPGLGWLSGSCARSPAAARGAGDRNPRVRES